MTTFRNIAILFIFNIIYYIDSKTTDVDLERNSQYITEKKDVIPIIYVNGSYYEIGFNIGFYFQNIIKDFLAKYEPLKRFELAAETAIGKDNYKKCLDVTKLYFPQYIYELQGIADGAKVEFKKLFLVHMDEIIMTNNGNYEEFKKKSNLEISTILVNYKEGKLIGYSVDVHKDTINHYYIVHAHIIPTTDDPSGVFKAREEKWTSLTYAGMLSGYLGGFNYHGLVYIIQNSLPKENFTSKIPHVFFTRALLASQNDVTEIEEILKNYKYGTANNFFVQFGFINKDTTFLYECNVTSQQNLTTSAVSTIQHVEKSETIIHTNKLNTTGLCNRFFEQCLMNWTDKETEFKTCKKGQTKNFQYVKEKLGNTNNPINTMISSIFDFNQMTWTIWRRNPKLYSPIFLLPLKYKDTFSPILNNN